MIPNAENLDLWTLTERTPGQKCWRCGRTPPPRRLVMVRNRDGYVKCDRCIARDNAANRERNR